MARGRMVTNNISRDKAINGLSDDTSRLAFTWLITFADKEGRVFGDPALIRSMLFPRRDDISNEQMTRYVTEWANAKLIIWYESDDEQWIWFPKFDKNQPGLRKEREPESEIPAFNPDTCRIIAGCLPDKCPVNGMEENGMEEKEKEQPEPERPEIFEVYEREIGALTPMIAESLLLAAQTYPKEWLAAAIQEAVVNNKRSWSYADAILKRWKVEGFKANSRNGPKPRVRMMKNADGILVEVPT